jgi:hypothetical protein
MTGARIGEPFVVAAGIGNRLFWFTEGNARLQVSPYSQSTRAIAIGLVGTAWGPPDFLMTNDRNGRAIVALSPDNDYTALVQLQQIEYEAAGHAVTLSRPAGAGAAQTRFERFAPAPVPDRLGDPPPRDEASLRRLDLARPETWPQSVAATGEVDGVPVVATGSVDGTVWIWDQRTLAPAQRPRAVAGPFVQLPPYVLEQGWDLLHVKPSLELATSVALGNLPGHGAVVAVACGGQARLYTIADGTRIENPADRASAVQCVAIGSLNRRTVLVTGSTGGNVAAWDPAAGTRVAGLYFDDPITNVAVESDRVLVRTATHGDYALELKEP